MKHINQVDARIPEETIEFLGNALNREERCVSVGGLAAEVGLLRADFPAEPDSTIRRGIADRLRLTREQAGSLAAKSEPGIRRLFDE
jgi:hypothetical protein